MFKQFTTGLLATTLVFGNVALANDTPTLSPEAQLLIASVDAMSDVTAISATGELSLRFARTVPTPFGLELDLSEVSVSISDINLSFVADVDNQDFRFFMGGTFDLVVPELFTLFLGDAPLSFDAAMLFDNGSTYLYMTELGWFTEPMTNLPADEFWAQMPEADDLDALQQLQDMMELIKPLFDMMPMTFVEASEPGHYAIASELDGPALLEMLNFAFTGEFFDTVLELVLEQDPELAEMVDTELLAEVDEIFAEALGWLATALDHIDIDLRQVDYFNQESLLPTQTISTGIISVDLNALLADTPFSVDVEGPVVWETEMRLFFDFDADSIAFPQVELADVEPVSETVLPFPANIR